MASASKTGRLQWLFPPAVLWWGLFFCPLTRCNCLPVPAGIWPSDVSFSWKVTSFSLFAYRIIWFDLFFLFRSVNCSFSMEPDSDEQQSLFADVCPSVVLFLCQWKIDNMYEMNQKQFRHGSLVVFWGSAGLYESVHRRLLFLSQTERERLENGERERYKTASGEIATYRMCWQDTAAEINSVKRCGKHPAPAPLHTPLIWDDTQETGREAEAALTTVTGKERGGDAYFLRYWHYRRLAPCHVCSVHALYEQAMKCVPLYKCFLYEPLFRLSGGKPEVVLML